MNYPIFSFYSILAMIILELDLWSQERGTWAVPSFCRPGHGFLIFWKAPRKCKCKRSSSASGDGFRLLILHYTSTLIDLISHYSIFDRLWLQRRDVIMDMNSGRPLIPRLPSGVSPQNHSPSNTRPATSARRQIRSREGCLTCKYV